MRNPTGPTGPALITSVDKEIPWDFNFDSGKFLKSDIDQAKLDIIEKQFKTTIMPVMNNINLIGQKIDVELIASTSKVPVGPNVASALAENGGYAGNNTGLSKARLDTLESIVKDLLFKYFSKEGDEKATFLKSLKNKVTITKKALANQGPDYLKDQGDDPKDDKFKKYQKLSLVIGASGDKILDDQKLSCNKNLSGKGIKGLPENNYVGYEKKVYLVAKKGTVMTTQFDPIMVPDCFFYSYNDTKFLSVFGGSMGSKLIEPFTQKRFDEINGRAQAGTSVAPVKEKINGKDYIVIDFKKVINDVYNKDNALIKAIEAKMKLMGEKRTIKEIQPKFFDAEGKIEVYATADPLQHPDTAPTLLPYIGGTKEAIKQKLIPTPIMAELKTFEFTLTKDFSSDFLKLAVFSPLAGTAFALKAKCS
jgi:hypothetical protein